MSYIQLSATDEVFNTSLSHSEGMTLTSAETETLNVQFIKNIVFSSGFINRLSYMC